jgi:hypothetical protein
MIQSFMEDANVNIKSHRSRSAYSSLRKSSASSRCSKALTISRHRPGKSDLTLLQGNRCVQQGGIQCWTNSTKKPGTTVMISRNCFFPLGSSVLSIACAGCMTKFYLSGSLMARSYLQVMFDSDSASYLCYPVLTSWLVHVRDIPLPSIFKHEKEVLIGVLRGQMDHLGFTRLEG